MKPPVIIGNNKFKYKKDAISHYSAILNSYEFGESLNGSDYDDIIGLLEYEENNESPGPLKFDGTNEADKCLTIEAIKVSKVQFNTRCFELLYSDNSSQYISYTMIIRNQKHTQEKLFYAACRNSVHGDIRAVKQEYFDHHSIKGRAKCQETGDLLTWEELVVDHRQPNTFSIIVDRFKEINRVDINSVEFNRNEKNHIVFNDRGVENEFKSYHKSKACLRVVKHERNSGRTGMARVKRMAKDLTIK